MHTEIEDFAPTERFDFWCVNFDLLDLGHPVGSFYNLYMICVGLLDENSYAMLFICTLVTYSSIFVVKIHLIAMFCPQKLSRN